MEYVKGIFDAVYGFFADNTTITALLMVIGGLKIIASRTKTKVDDQVLAIIEWPLKKGYELLGKVVTPKK